jgi:hypothetical protein
VIARHGTILQAIGYVSPPTDSPPLFTQEDFPSLPSPGSSPSSVLPRSPTPARSMPQASAPQSTALSVSQALPASGRPRRRFTQRDFGCFITQAFDISGSSSSSSSNSVSDCTESDSEQSSADLDLIPHHTQSW